MPDQSLIPHDAGLDLMTLGDVLAKSGYFTDAKTQAQAVVKVLYGHEMGVSAIAAMMGIHIIQGKPAPSAGLIAAVIRRSGAYDYRVLEHTDDVCSIEFVYRGERAGVSTFTMADARRANLPSTNKVWNQYPRNLLYARAMSNGARWYCADIFGGAVYTPEELGAVVDGEGTVIRTPPELPAPAVPEEAPAAVVDSETGELKLPHPDAIATDDDRDGATVWEVGGVRCLDRPNPNGGRYLFGLDTCPDHLGYHWTLGPTLPSDAWAHSLGKGSAPCRRRDVVALTAEQSRMIWALSGDAGLGDDELIAQCHERFGRGPAQLSIAQADDLVAALSDTVAVIHAFPAGASA